MKTISDRAAAAYFLGILTVGPLLLLLSDLVSPVAIGAEGWAAIAAFLSVIVALIACYISRYQIQAADKAARLSVIPHCVLIQQKDNFENAPHGLVLRNNGSGPAIIVEWSYCVKGVMLPEKNKKGLMLLKSRYRLDRLMHGMLLAPDASLGSNRDERMFYLPTDIADSIVFPGITARKAMDNLLDDVEVILKYASLYGDETTIRSHD